jgi:serine/threonine protein phosphatase PrpC
LGGWEKWKNMKIKAFGASDLGRVRKLNEDFYKIVQDRNLLIACDGMGGHAAGEVASRIAVDTIEKAFSHQETLSSFPIPKLTANLPTFSLDLVKAVRLANRQIYNLALLNSSQRGMGTTVVAVLLEKGLVTICHVGDSRGYRIRKEMISQLTKDHSLVAEMVERNEITECDSAYLLEKNVITRALGNKPVIKVDLRIDSIQKNDIYLLCTDGLTNFVSDRVILQTIMQNSGNLMHAGMKLIEKANSAGGKDNITLILAEIEELKDAKNEPTIKITFPEETEEELYLQDQFLKKLEIAT